MGWHGRIPPFRLIGETVVPIGLFAAGSPADLFACLDITLLYDEILKKYECPPFLPCEE